MRIVSASPLTWFALAWCAFVVVVRANEDAVVELDDDGVAELGDDGVADADVCARWISDGDAETGDPSALAGDDVVVAVNGTVSRPDATRSFSVAPASYRDGPSSPVPRGCLERGRQYEVTAALRLPYGCDRNAPWGDPRHCPLVTVRGVDADGRTVSYNVGDNATATTGANEWSHYRAVFTVDERLASVTSAVVTLRGVSEPYHLDHFSVSAYEGMDTPYNAHETFVDADDEEWTAPATSGFFGDSAGDDGPCGDAVTNGDAESGDATGWVAHEGGSVVHRVDGADGPYFAHVDRPFQNSGFGQTAKTECFVPGRTYLVRARVKLFDVHGFPVACDRRAAISSVAACLHLTFTYQDENDRGLMVVRDESDADWRSKRFNDFVALFRVPADRTLGSWYFGGVAAGVAAAYRDVSIVPFDDPAPALVVADEFADGNSCASLVTGGDAESQDLSNWSVMDVLSGSLEVAPGGPPDHSYTFRHKNRLHINSGPGQVLDVSCLVQGLQYKISAIVKVEDQRTGVYACDKYAEWTDPDFCPLFTVHTTTPVEGQKPVVRRFNMGNDYPKHLVYFEGDFNHYEAIFTVDERLANATEAYLYLRGPRADAYLYWDDVELVRYEGEDTRFNFWTGVPTVGAEDQEVVLEDDDLRLDPTTVVEYKHYQDTLDPPADPCDELVKNGDAENNSLEHWETWNSPFGEMRMHNVGPPNATRSFLLTERTEYGSAAGQRIDTECLPAEPVLYEVRAKIKLLDRNGFPLHCNKNALRFSPGGCPMFTLKVPRPDGTQGYVTKFNDMGVPWVAGAFNEFHAFLTITPDVKASIDPYWFFQGPEGGVIVAMDDISIRPYEEQPVVEEQTPVPDPPICGELIANRNATSGTLDRWETIWGDTRSGNGFLTLSDEDEGPPSGGPAFVMSARQSMSNGPATFLDVSCFRPYSRYVLTFKYYLENGRSQPYDCDSDERFVPHQETPLLCPMATIWVKQPFRSRQFTFHSKISVPLGDHWHEYRTEVSLHGQFYHPSQARFIVRGPPRDTTIYFTDVSVAEVNGPVYPTKPDVEEVDPTFDCGDAFCCELVKNPTLDVDVTDWIQAGFAGGNLASVEGGADGSPKALRHSGRVDINSGPGQYFDPKCLVPDMPYEIKAKVKILDENGAPIACRPIPEADWNDPDVCPMLSLRANEFVWFDVHNFAPTKDVWSTDGYNDYHSFYVPDPVFLKNAGDTIYFMFRGPRPGVQIVVDEVSIAPYQHVPDFAPELFEIEKSSDADVIDGYNDTRCNIPVINGDLEFGNTTGWTVHRGGELSVRSCDVNGGRFCLQTSARTSRYMGPMQEITFECWKEGRTFAVEWKAKLLDESFNPYPCDVSAGPHSECPIFTVRYKTATGEYKWKYIDNLDFEPWDKNNFNDFHGLFKVDAEMAGATEAHWYIERPPAGITILVDEVKILEFILEADADYKEMSQSCKRLVMNGNAESGDTRGWTPRFGGEISLHDEGADHTHHSIMHSGRHSFIMGPKHDLMYNCFMPGMVYLFEAKIKLINESDGSPFYCDKNYLWGHELACAILTFQIEKSDGTTDWMYYNDQTKGLWGADSWNYFHTPFQVVSTIENAKKAVFYLERPAKDVSILIDEVTITRDCSVLLPNWNAEQPEVTPWINYKDKYGGVTPGRVSRIQGGYDGSAYAFLNAGRTRLNDGPGHVLDAACLVRGAKYELTAFVKLRDPNNDNAPFACDRNAQWGQLLNCPMISFMYYNQDGTRHHINAENNVVADWVAEEFNRHHSIFTVTDELANSGNAWFHFRGVYPGIDIIFDNVQIKIWDDPDCDNLIPNGDFESVNTDGWDVGQSGKLAAFREGANGTATSLIATGREVSSDGIMVDVDTMCMIEGRMWTLTAYLKLFDEDMNPFVCDRSAALGEALACPILVIEIHERHGFHQYYPQTREVGDWIGGDWNKVTAVFTVSNELANAERAFFKFKGPAPGVAIAIDGVFTERYYDPKDDINCAQLIKRTNAMSDDTDGWLSSGGGSIEIIDGGYDSNAKAFAHTGRPTLYSGPGQTVNSKCLAEGLKYEFNAKFKLRDETGEFVACDKNVDWKHEDYCILATFIMTMPGDEGEVRQHFGSEYGGPWVRSEFNPFKKTLYVTEEMSRAKEILLVFRGPRPGVDIVFDNISMKRLDTNL